MSNFVDIDTRVVCQMSVVTVPARVKQHSVCFIFFRVEHVIAFRTEVNSDETGLIVLVIFIHFGFVKLTTAVIECQKHSPSSLLR